MPLYFVPFTPLKLNEPVGLLSLRMNGLPEKSRNMSSASFQGISADLSSYSFFDSLSSGFFSSGFFSSGFFSSGAFGGCAAGCVGCAGG
jgi:hypothetical protein